MTEDLRTHGYMTPAEFIKKITPGLLEYLNENLGTKIDYLQEDLKERLSHPEDLVLNTVAYFEVMYHVVADLGVASTTEKKEREKVLGSPEFDDHPRI